VVARKQSVRWAIGVACLALASLALLWPGGSVGSGAIDGGADAPGELTFSADYHKLSLKAGAVNELIAGRRTLASTVDRFEAIEGQFPELAEASRRHLEALYPGRSFRDVLAQNVLAFTRWRLRGQPGPAEAILARLDSEFAAFAGTAGTGRGDSTP
jgi:hypothetical protein